MLRCALLTALAATLTTAAAQEDRFPGPEYQNPFANPKDDPNLPRVLIIGDSISIAYTTTVRRELHGRANVHRIPVNGAYSAFGAENVKKWTADGRWDVIHFNFGLWDWYGWKQETRATPESYADNLRKIVAHLKTTGARLIFATTTPPCEEPEHKIKVLVTDEQARAFNDAAVAVMKANGIRIDDLHRLISKDRARYAKGKADVHFNREGNEFLGKQVAASIRSALDDTRRIAELDAYWAEVSRSVKEGDFEAYAATCHKDGVLVAGTVQRCHPLSAALARWKQEFVDTKAGRRKSSVVFRFSQRLGDATTAHETGIFLYSFSVGDGPRKDEYIHFQVLLRKTADGWKSMMEYQISRATPGEWEALK